MLAAALIAQALESAFPPLFPGLPVKLGLANAVTLFALDAFGEKSAVMIQGARCMLGALLSLSPVGALYSLSGAALSLGIMLPLNRLRLSRGWISFIGVSVAGAFFHTLGQLLAGALLVGPAVLAYFTPMELLSIPTGFFIGCLSALAIRIKKVVS